MDTQLRILILEDSVDDVEFIERQLKKGDFKFSSRVVENRNDFENQLTEFKPDVILSDHSLPMFDSMIALQMFHSYKKIFNPAAVFILVTGTVSEEFAVQVMRNGADDYILKDRLKRLPAAITNALEKNRLKEQRRKEQEEKVYLFDILQKSLHEIYLINSHTFCFEYANEEASNNLGYTLQELRTMNPADVIESFSRQDFQRTLLLAQENEKGLLLQRKAIRKNGTSYPVQVHLQIIGHGEKKRILANVLDMTEAMALEEQSKLAGFIQNSFNYNRDLKSSLEIVLDKLCNSCSCLAIEIYSREFGHSGSKLLASHKGIEKGGTKIGKVLAEEVYKSGKIEYSKSIGMQVKTSKINGAVAIPLELGGEIVAVLIGFVEEEESVETKFLILSDQVRAKLASNIKRKKSEEELQKIFDFTPDILMVLGKDGFVRKVNPAIEKILGYSPEKVLSTSIDNFLHPEDKAVLKEWRRKELKAYEIAHYESRWQAHNGEYKWFSWSVSLYLNDELHFAVGKDITESKKQMNAINEQNAKLTEIAWSQSHVVRAPLARLLACVEYLEENHNKPLEVLSNVKQSAYEIDKIIRDIILKSEKVELNEKG